MVIYECFTTFTCKKHILHAHGLNVTRFAERKMENKNVGKKSQEKEKERGVR